MLKLKFFLQYLQIIWTICWFNAFFIDFDTTSNVFNWKFEFFETCRINVFENVFVKILSKRFNEINFDWILNYSKTKSHKHFDNKFNKFVLRYKWRHCCKYCKNVAISLYNSNSNSLNVNVESKISIFWKIDVDLTICFVFDVFLNFDVSNLIFNFCYFCEINNFDEMKIDCIVTNLLKKMFSSKRYRNRVMK